MNAEVYEEGEFERESRRRRVEAEADEVWGAEAGSGRSR